MGNQHIFDVQDVFHFKDGKTVFAGNFLDRIKKFGLYSFTVGDREVAKIIISGEMIFPSKGIDAIAIYTYDPIPKEGVDLTKPVKLVLIQEMTRDEP